MCLKACGQKQNAAKRGLNQRDFHRKYGENWAKFGDFKPELSAECQDASFPAETRLL
jgi:hypothetical protein